MARRVILRATGGPAAGPRNRAGRTRLQRTPRPRAARRVLSPSRPWGPARSSHRRTRWSRWGGSLLAPLLPRRRPDSTRARERGPRRAGRSGSAARRAASAPPPARPRGAHGGRAGAPLPLRPASSRRSPRTRARGRSARMSRRRPGRIGWRPAAFRGSGPGTWSPRGSPAPLVRARCAARPRCHGRRRGRRPGPPRWKAPPASLPAAKTRASSSTWPLITQLG